MRTLPNRRRHSAHRNRGTRISGSSALARPRRPLFESLENRSLLAALPWNEVSELAVPYGLSNAGSSGESRLVAMEGDTVVVGVRNNDQVAVDAGAAYVFQRNSNGTPSDVGDDSWTLVQTLYGTGTSPPSSDLQTGDFFGESIAINGNWMFIGADHPTELCCPTPALGDGLGVVYVYQKINGVWQYHQTLEPVDRGGIHDRFGNFEAIAIEGDLAAIGAPFDDNQNGVDAGAVHIYRLIDNVWTHTTKLISPDPGAGRFGFVKLDDGELLVGAVRGDGASAASGAVYLFAETNGQWQQTAQLIAADGQPQDGFGYPIAKQGDTIVVGADEADIAGTDSGAAYIFERTNGNWSQTARILSSDLQASDHFGRQVGLQDGTILVGSWFGNGVLPNTGAVYAFEKVAGQWTQVDRLYEADRTFGGIPGPSFGAVMHYGNSGEAVISTQGAGSSGSVYVWAQDATRQTTAYRNTTPQTIADRRGKTSGVTTSTINVTDAGTILDLDVRLDITHPNDNDLSVVLVSPSGIQIPLFAQVGGTGDNFTTTVLDSQASTPIASGTAPFTGRFRPAGNLANLNGASIQGTWQLVVTDSATGSTGTLQGWSVRLKYQLPVPQLSISDATATEGSAAQAAFTVSLSSPNALEVTVDYATATGSADAGDFYATSGTITFVPGQTSRTILVQTLPDDLVEGNETFTVTLTSPTGGELADAVGIGTIIDDDLPPSVDVVAAGDTNVFGDVEGSYQATWQAGGNVQTLTEERYSGNKRTRLEHSWRFDGVASGDTIELIVVATHQNAIPAETFAFAWSTNGTTWTTLGNLGPTSFTLPNNLSGTVYIRVTDTDRNNDATLDVLDVDQLLIRSTTAGQNSSAAAAASSTAATSAETDAALLMWITEDSLTTTRRK